MPAQTLKDINKEIEKLQRQAEEIRSKEKREAIQNVLNLVEQYEISAEDLGFEMKFSRSRGRPAKKTARKVAYRKGDLTWSGGRGARPQWVKEVLEKEGREALEKYRV